MWDFVTDNWSTIKDAAACAAPILAALGLHHHARRWWNAWRERRAERREDRRQEAAERADWYRTAYMGLMVTESALTRMSGTQFHALTVQQACAHLDCTIPACLRGWERVRVGRLN